MVMVFKWFINFYVLKILVYFPLKNQFILLFTTCADFLKEMFKNKFCPLSFYAGVPEWSNGLERYLSWLS